MTATLPETSRQPPWTTSRVVWGLIIVVGASANSLDRPHRLPLDAVLWTAGLVLALYGCVWAVAMLASRPLSSRTDLRLQELAYLILLAAAAWSVVSAALSGQQVASVAAAFMAAYAGHQLRVAARKMRVLPPGDGHLRPE